MWARLGPGRMGRGSRGTRGVSVSPLILFSAAEFGRLARAVDIFFVWRDRAVTRTRVLHRNVRTDPSRGLGEQPLNFTIEGMQSWPRGSLLPDVSPFSGRSCAGHYQPLVEARASNSIPVPPTAERRHTPGGLVPSGCSLLRFSPVPHNFGFAPAGPDL